MSQECKVFRVQEPTLAKALAYAQRMRGVSKCERRCWRLIVRVSGCQSRFQKDDAHLLTLSGYFD